MNIAVLVKQVPETDSLTMDPETGTVVRSEDTSIVNPLDLYAIEAALRLKDADPGVKVTAISMGPPQAARALSEALAMGCDDAILLSGKEFAGSDTWATARALSGCIESARGTGGARGFDLVLCGEKATDGDTGQVGPEVAAFLDIPVVTYSGSVELGEKDGQVFAKCFRVLEDSIQTVECPVPLVISLSKALGEPRLPTLRGKKKAARQKIPVWTAAELGQDKDHLGLVGSPTRVVSIDRPKIARNGVRIDARQNRAPGDQAPRVDAGDALLEAADKLLAFLSEKGFLRRAFDTPDESRLLTAEAAEAAEAGKASAEQAGARALGGVSKRSDRESPPRARKDPTRSIWVLAETKSGRVDPTSFELLAWARGLVDGEGEEDGRVEIVAVLPGGAQDRDLLGLYGADRVLYSDDPSLAGYSARDTAIFLSRLLDTHSPDVFLASATTTGRTVMPYLAALRHLGLTADCTQLSLDIDTGILLQTRPAAGGNIMATIKTTKGFPQMATVRPHSKKPREEDSSLPFSMELVPVLNPQPSRGDSEGGQDGATGPAHAVRIVSERPFGDKEELSSAKIVVSGGRGFKKKENFTLLNRLAEAFGAGLGASREAVDRGWAEYPSQVGLSGRTISPDLYIAAGISGAIQHLAGMQTSGCIVSINSDPDAPIFAVSDFAVVADLFDFIPVLLERLKFFRQSQAEEPRARPASLQDGKGARHD